MRDVYASFGVTSTFTFRLETSLFGFVLFYNIRKVLINLGGGDFSNFTLMKFLVRNPKRLFFTAVLNKVYDFRIFCLLITHFFLTIQTLLVSYNTDDLSC